MKRPLLLPRFSAAAALLVAVLISNTLFAQCTATISAASTSLCNGDNTTITVSGSPGAVVSYTLNGQPESDVALDAVSGIATINTGPLTTTANYDLTSVSNSISGCSEPLTGGVTISVNPLPTVLMNSASSTICTGDSTDISFYGTPNCIVSYTINGAPAEITLDAAGSAMISSGSLTATTVISLVSAALPTTACVNALSGSTTITVNSSSTATISGSTAILSGGSANITFTGNPGATVAFTVNGGPVTQIPLDGISGIAILNTGNLTNTTVYEIAWVMSPSGCMQPITGQIATVTIGTPANPTESADSFLVYIDSSCASIGITIVPAQYGPSSQIETWYGDGAWDTNNFPGTAGYCTMNHTYTYPGVYSIKHLMYNAGNAIDSIQYAYTAVICNTMRVQFYYDNNGNCVKDIIEPANSLPVQVEVDSNGVFVDSIATTSGINYIAHGIPGDIYTFKITPAPGGFHVTCPATAIVYDTMGTANTFPDIRYVGMQCNTGNDFDLSVNATIPVTGVNDQWGNIYVQNLFCQPTDGTLTLHYSPKYAGTPSQIYPSATSISGNTITWDLNALAGTTPNALQIHYAIWSGSTQVPIGDTTQSYFVITPTGGDADTSNNVRIIIDTVKAGCDPNEMWVTPATCIASGTLPTQLKYTINFENTGNDTAHNVYVLDTLSGNVDANSMRMVMSSNEMYISKILDAAGETVLKFDFPHINLLDSSHHGECDGALIFTVNTKPGLADSTNISNRAGIYFDVNPVVMTNQVTNTIGCPNTDTGTTPTAVSNMQKLISGPVVYPNPASNSLTIQANGKFSSYTITNGVGSVVFSDKISQPQIQVNINTLPSGLYFVNIKGEGGLVVRKFVKAD